MSQCECEVSVKVSVRVGVRVTVRKMDTHGALLGLSSEVLCKCQNLPAVRFEPTPVAIPGLALTIRLVSPLLMATYLGWFLQGKSEFSFVKLCRFKS